MPLLSFRIWLEARPQEVPDTAAIALAIARSGTAGAFIDDLRRLVGSPEALEEVLRGLLASGQVEVVRVGGRNVYRAVG
jgi:hypothetical protein